MKYLALMTLWLGFSSLPAAAQVAVQTVPSQSTDPVAALPTQGPADGFCIVNGDARKLLFITETREGVRQSAVLAPNDWLCATQTDSVDGIVSVFENDDSFEGCSRVVAVGTTEAMLKFAEADRCTWSSHNS